MKWSQMTTEQKRRQVEAAHAAARGQQKPFDVKCKAAKTREQTPEVYASPYESQLRALLARHDLHGIPQLAVGPYNCDLAIYPVSVEVWGGGWHFSGRHLARTPERFRYLMNEGWNIYVIVASATFPLTATVADQAATYIKQTCRNPPPICEYRVVWGASEFSISGRANDDEIAIVKPFTHRRDPRTGQYERVAR